MHRRVPPIVLRSTVILPSDTDAHRWITLNGGLSARDWQNRKAHPLVGGRMFQPRRMVSGSADKCDRHALARPPAAAAAAVATCAVFDAASAPLTRIHTPRGRHRQTSETLFPRERNGPLGRRLRRRPDRRRQFLQVCRLADAARKKRKYKDEVLLQKRARENRWTRGSDRLGAPAKKSYI